MELVGLKGLGKRRTTELSGGPAPAGGPGPGPGAQPAAAPAGRALRRPGPLRPGAAPVRPCAEILQESGIPTLLVTHDGDEALSLGDRFLMMQEGSLRPHPASDLQDS